MQCPSSVKEGGLVAHAAFDCPVDGLPIGKEYCEYRDGTGANDWPDSDLLGRVRQRPRAYITINATTGGQWIVASASTPLLVAAGPNQSANTLRYNIQAGKTKKIEILVYGRGNYRKEGNTTGDIVVLPPGSGSFNDAIASCTVTIQDDDNTAYVGSRYHHPYGLTWRSRPYCYDEVGCASRQ